MKLKDRIRQASEALQQVAEIPPEPALGLDFDGTITDAPVFFSLLARIWEGPVYIVTYRDNEEATLKEAASLGITNAKVVLVNSFAQKAQVIKDLNIKVFFDDMDEVITHIPADCVVFKIRNEGNYDFSDGKWLYSKFTGKQI